MIAVPAQPGIQNSAYRSAGLYPCETRTASHPFSLSAMRLSDLAREVPGAILQPPADPTVSSASSDSRSITPGSIFVAITGFSSDGHDYLEAAIAAGASAVAVRAGSEGKWRTVLARRGVGVLVVPDARVALARIAAAVESYPARRLLTVGVTGTDGKTSLSHLLAHVLSAAGRKAGLVSTAECRIGESPLPDTGRFTTPEAPEVQHMLGEMVSAGCRWGVIEATSHGLALHRVDECEFDVAVFTNLSRDHMDFHGSVEDYMAAKGRLFAMLDGSAEKGIEKTAVLNSDDAASQYFRSLTGARIVTYGVLRPGDFRGVILPAEGWSSRFVLPSNGRDHREIVMRKPGLFNVYNALAAVAVASVAGIESEAVAAALESWPGAPGRMEVVHGGHPFTVVVDFAHSPDSLKRILELLRERSAGRIIAVFGCIGERDKDRRFRMGQVAADCADYTIVTDDNPYSEDRHAIIAEIASGLRFSGKRDGHDFALIPDRREAIAQALAMAVDGDAVLLAGKGHEREVHLPDSVYPCHDPDVARRVLRDLGYRG